MTIERVVHFPDAQNQQQELSRYPAPDFIVPDLTVELFEFLNREHGIKKGIFDLDNTLASGTGYEVDEASIQVLQQARANGFLEEYGILSNIQADLPFFRTFERRVEYFAQLFDTKFWHAAKAPITKPDPRAFQIVLDMMKANPEETVFVGDQLGKDILGARNAGIAVAVLRFPPVGKDPPYRYWKRQKEQAIITNFLVDQEIKNWRLKNPHANPMEFLNNFYGLLPGGFTRINLDKNPRIDELQTGLKNASVLYQSKTLKEFLRDVDDAVKKAGATKDECVKEQERAFKEVSREAGQRYFDFLLPIYINLRIKGYKHEPDLTG